MRRVPSNSKRKIGKSADPDGRLAFRIPHVIWREFGLPLGLASDPQRRVVRRLDALHYMTVHDVGHDSCVGKSYNWSGASCFIRGVHDPQPSMFDLDRLSRWNAVSVLLGFVSLSYPRLKPFCLIFGPSGMALVVQPMEQFAFSLLTLEQTDNGYSFPTAHWL